MEIRHRYDGKQDEVSEMSSLSCKGDPGKTKQAHRDECDINKITAKYERTGQLPDLIRSNPRYGDFTDVPTYQEALDRVILAGEQFNALDAHIRARFGNDPALFLEFATDKRNMKELVKMGLAVEQPLPPPVVAPPSDGSGAGAVAPPAVSNPGAKL